MVLKNNDVYLGIVKKLPFVFLCFLVAFPVLPHAVQSIFIALFATTSLYSYYKSFKDNLSKYTLKLLLINVGWFLLLALTIFYSENKEDGLKRIVRALNILIFPVLIFYFLPTLTQKKKNILSYIFILVHVFLVFYLYTRAIDGIDKLGYINQNGDRIRGLLDESLLEQFRVFIGMPFFLSRYYINENEASFFFIHKAYLSIGFVWSIFLSIDRIINQKTNIKVKVSLTIVSLFFIVVVIYFTSIPNLLALVLLLPTFLIFNLKTWKKRLISFSAIIVLMITATQIGVVKERLFDDVRLKKDIQEAKSLITSIIRNESQENTNIRGEIWRCSYQKIKEKALFGYGIGEEEQVLNQCYIENNCQFCVDNELNTHNYYASLLLTGGVVLLTVFILSFVYMFILSIKAKNFLYTSFLMLILLNLLSENLFVRIHGILFYVLFNSILFLDSWRRVRNNNSD